MTTACVVAASVALQFAAALAALRLCWTTRWDKAWLLIASAVFLMAVRRSVTFVGIVTDDAVHGADLPAELIALLISVLMVAGLFSIGPLFAAMTRSEAAIRESEERFRGIFENTMVGLYRTTPDGRILMANAALVGMLGYASFEELARRNLEEEGYGPDYARSDFKRRIETQGTVVGLESAWTRADGGTLFVRESARAVRDPRGNTLFYEGTVEDITGLRLAEKEREKLIAELEARNSELERFTYTVSHDLKSPLITIKGYLNLLEDDLAQQQAESVEEDVNCVVGAADRMERLIDDLLQLSRIGRLLNPLEPVSLGELAREAVQLVAGRIAQRGARVEIAPDLPMVLGDRSRLLEVLQNLVDNAVKYMGNQPEPRIEIGVRSSGDRPVFFVRDNGIGIVPAYQERIFDLFSQFDKRAEGSGIGLALVKRIIEVHGGRIWVESEGPGHGSTFCFTLPPTRSRSESPTQ
jgi:PAS domain S-box-containing protein